MSSKRIWKKEEEEWKVDKPEENEIKVNETGKRNDE